MIQWADWPQINASFARVTRTRKDGHRDDCGETPRMQATREREGPPNNLMKKAKYVQKRSSVKQTDGNARA